MRLGNKLQELRIWITSPFHALKGSSANSRLLLELLLELLQNHHKKELPLPEQELKPFSNPASKFESLAMRRNLVVPQNVARAPTCQRPFAPSSKPSSVTWNP